MRLLFGAEFADAAPALPVLMATFVVVSVGYLTGYLIIAYGLQRQFVVIGVGALVLNVAANLALVPSYGFMAAAWITLGTEILVMSLSMALVCRAMRRGAVGRAPGRIVIASAADGPAAGGCSQAGLPPLRLGRGRGAPLPACCSRCGSCARTRSGRCVRDPRMPPA